MIDLLIVLAFVVYAICVGLRSRKKASQNLQEYFLAGKTLKGWQAGISMAATQFAADTPLLVTGLIATGGIFLVWRLWIYGLGFLLIAFVFAAGWRRAGVLTDAELTEIRYSGRGVLGLRILKALYYGTVMNCVVMGMVLVAAVRIAEVFLPWHEWLPGGFYNGLLNSIQSLGLSLSSNVTGLDPVIATTNNVISILAILSFTALYSTTGGLRSVVATDVMQFSLAMVGSIVYAYLVIDHVGGFGNLTDRLVSIYGPDQAGKMVSFGPTGGEVFLPFLVLIGLQWFFERNSDGTGYLAQRSMACVTDRDARVAGVVFSWLQILVRSLIWLVIGVGLLVLYPFTPENATGDQFAASREILFVTGIDELLPIGIRGLMLTGLLAALASTIDTHLNWGASYWSNDIYQRLICKHWLKREPKSNELVIAARLSNILILIIALTIMANLGSIQTGWYITLLFGAGMGAVLILRWLWERINLYSEITAIAASLVIAPILLAFVEAEWVRLAWMAFISTTAVVVVTLLTPPTEVGVLKSFYERVRPMGYWRKTAAAVGDEVGLPTKRLRGGLKTTLLTSLSLFLLLIGIGKLMIRHPEQSMIWAWLYIG
ncbi:MAG: sodium:solute symporter family protein, partial [bacterium]